MPRLRPFLARATPLIATLALAACRSAPAPVAFDPDPLTKWRWRGIVAPVVGQTADASGSAVAPAPPPLAAGPSRESNGEVAPATVGPRLSGTAVVQPGATANETQAFVTLGGLPAGSWWRWRVVDGECRGGTAVSPAERYPVLQASADGYAESFVILPVPAPRSARWAVEVLRRDAAVASACAPLVLGR